MGLVILYLHHSEAILHDLNFEDQLHVFSIRTDNYRNSI